MNLPPEFAGLVIVIDDIIPPAGPYCSWGARKWARLHGLDPRGFFEGGIPAEAILALNDHMGDEVVARKIRRLSE